MFVLGIDVSKEKLDCYLASDVEEKPKHANLFQVENGSDGFEKIALKLSKKGLTFESLIGLTTKRREFVRLIQKTFITMPKVLDETARRIVWIALRWHNSD